MYCVRSQGDNLTRCILFNYMIDLDWLIDAVPRLCVIPRVDIVHGERNEQRARAITVRNPPRFRSLLALTKQAPNI